ncbi:MAG: hypothetical protein LBL00_00560 [Endomicrobium sp.]|jgi:tetratricopeptide (TPR) repeat protein|nr:hypothetical protein [Endomicrobium sp.]
MKKKRLIFIFCCFAFAVAFICGCSNGNIFSWAHDSGKGDYASLMSDGNAAMKDKNYKKAENYYQSAMNKKPDDKEAIYGYSSAVFADAVGPVFTDIVNTVISGSSAEELFDNLDYSKLKALEDALEKIVGKNNDLLSKIVDDDAVSYEDGMVDKNLNAAVSYLLYGVLQVINNPDADVQEALNFYGNFKMELDTIPRYDDPTIAPSVRNAIEELISYVEKAYRCIERVSSDYGVSTSFIDDVRTNNAYVIRALQLKRYHFSSDIDISDIHVDYNDR